MRDPAVSGIWSRGIVQIVVEKFSRILQVLKISVVPREFKKLTLSLKRLTSLKMSDLKS